MALAACASDPRREVASLGSVRAPAAARRREGLAVLPAPGPKGTSYAMFKTCGWMSCRF